MELSLFSVLSQDMQRLPEAVQYIEKASMMYVENGTPDTAAMALDRAGKYVLILSDLYMRADERSVAVNQPFILMFAG